MRARVTRAASWAAFGALLAAAVAGAGLKPSSAPAAAERTSPVPRGCTSLLVAGSGSLGRFVRRLHRGDIGCLRGTFETNLFIRNSGFRLRSAPGTRATIKGIVWVTRSGHDVVLAWLALDGEGQSQPGVQVNGSGITFRNDDITNRHTTSCVLVGGDFEHYGVASGVVLSGNRIHGCGRLPPTNHDHGIYVEGARGTRIVNNLIYDNADYGIHLYPDADRSYIARNVITANGMGLVFAGEESGGEYSQSYASSNNVVERNVISDSTVRYNVESWWGGPVGTGNILRKNCLWNGKKGNVDLSEGGFTVSRNIIANPLFVNPLAGDFRLLPRSRCAAVVR